MNPTDTDRAVRIDVDLDLEAAVAALLHERHGCQTIRMDTATDEECGARAVIVRLRRMTCGHEEHVAWRYACIDHAGGKVACWHCTAPIDVLIELPIGRAS